MMRPRWAKVFSDLWDNKVRSLLVVLSIAVGVFAVGMIAGAYFIISNDMSAGYASGNPANIELWTNSIDAEFLKNLQRLPGVGEVEGRRLFTVRVLSGEGEWLSVDIISIPDFEETRINLHNPVQGVKIPAERQVVLEQKRFADLHRSIGQPLQIQLPDGSEKELMIAGIVQDQATGAGDYLSTPMGFITMDTLTWLHQPDSFNRVLVTVAEDSNNEAHIHRVANQVIDKMEQSGHTVFRTLISRTRVHPMASTVTAVLGILMALGVLIVILSSSLIANTMSSLLNQHLRQIGVMKLIGGRSAQITGMYMLLILAFGLIALAISIPLGGQAAYALSGLIAGDMNFALQGYRIIPYAIISQVIIALFIPLVSGIFPVINGARIKIRQALAGPEMESAGAKVSRFDRMIHGIRWLPRPRLISIRNTFRRKGRLALTLFTLMLGGAIFIAVFNVRMGLDTYVHQLSQYFLADVNLVFERSYRVDEIHEYALTIPGVSGIEGWAYASAEWQDENGEAINNIQILAPPAQSSLVNPMLLTGRWIQPGDENAITVNEAILDDFPDVKVGDRLLLDIGGKVKEWVLVGIFKFVGTDSLIGYTSYEYLTGLLHRADILLLTG